MAWNSSVNVLAPIRRKWAFQLGKSLFDRVQVGRVRRQEEDPASMRRQGRCRFLVLVGGKVVEDDDGARFNFRYQHFVQIGCEGRAIHCALDDPRRDQGVLAQPGGQRLGSPTAKWRVHRQPLAAQGPSPQAGEPGFHSGFVNKHNVIGMPPNRWQPMGKPFGALVSCLGTAAFGGDQRLFCT